MSDEGRLTEDAQKRLTAIQQFTELGSGFRIAAADLEIRGAGNLLGKQQSGHIAAIGLDLYIQMVEQAVQRLKGQVVEEEPDPALRLNVSAFIPEDYVADSHQRLSFYKRLASSTQVGDLALLHGELQDRFGQPPDPVERLFEVMQVRMQAKALRVASIELKTGSVVVTLDAKSPVAATAIQRLMDQYKKRLRFLSPLSFELQMPHQDWPSLFPGTHRNLAKPRCPVIPTAQQNRHRSIEPGDSARWHRPVPLSFSHFVLLASDRLIGTSCSEGCLRLAETSRASYGNRHQRVKQWTTAKPKP